MSFIRDRASLSNARHVEGRQGEGDRYREKVRDREMHMEAGRKR